jgi:signal transduction histidine kinase
VRYAKARVQVEAVVEDGAARVRVADDGPGIDPAHLEHVFDRFWRTDRAGGGGAGLGLAIARGLVEAHGGRIGVDSAPGRGTTFWFELPAA